MHLALSTPNDGLNIPDYSYQAKAVARLIPKPISGRSIEVLEVASGTGYNLRLLATSRPDVKFFGIDLSLPHVAVANLSSRRLENVKHMRGDFANIAAEDDTFDVVFSIEGLCHGERLGEVIGEAWRVLKPGGVLVIFDMLRGEMGYEVPPSLLDAARVVEHSLEIPNLPTLRLLGEAARAAGLVVEAKDLSQLVIPELGRLNRLALRYVYGRRRAPLARVILPSVVKQNVIAGLLLLPTVNLGVHRYMMVTGRRGIISGHGVTGGKDAPY